MTTTPPEITKAIQLFKETKIAESREILRAFLLNQPGHRDALLWLAKVSPDADEAMSAANLALALSPQDQVAQRAVSSVSERFQGVKEISQQSVIATASMPLAQANAVIWPFRGLNRPIGVLLEEKMITLKDIVWAFENATQQKIRQACETILLYAIIPSISVPQQKKPMRIISGRNFSDYLVRTSVLWGGVIIGIMVTFTALIIGLTIAGSINPLIFGGVLSWYGSLTLLVCTIVLAAIADRYATQMEQARKGLKGEQTAVDIFRATLASPWVLVQNFEFSDRAWGDVDIILLGPGGVWVFEVKAYSTLTRNRGDQWEYRSRFGWQKLGKHPGKQARQGAKNLKDYIEQKTSLKMKWIQPVVLWAGENDLIIVDDPATPVITIQQLQDYIETMTQRALLSQADIDRISDLLNTHAENIHG